MPVSRSPLAIDMSSRSKLTKDPTVHRLVKEQAERAPNAIAIIAPGRPPLTFGALFDQVERAADELNAMGIGRDDRVATVLPNGPETAVAFLGVACAAVAAPLNPAYRESEFDFYLTDLKAKAIIVQSGRNSPAIAVARRLGMGVIALSPAPDAAAGVFTLDGSEASLAGSGGPPSADDIALILYTSGTTAKPKRVPLTHRNLLASTQNIKKALALQVTDRCLNVMPLYHIHALLNCVLSSLAAASSIAVLPDFNTDDFFAWIEEMQPTWYSGNPTIHQAIYTAAKSRSGEFRHSLRFIRSATASLPPAVMAELEEMFKAPVIETYGMTETCSQIASNPLPPLARKPGSVGLRAGPEIAVIDENGKFLPRGEAGEIVIRGDTVMRGYKDNPKANEEAFIDGWFRSGDQGYFDADGYLFLTGRLKEMINCGGEKVSPYEVEAVLIDHPAIAEAAVFPVGHDSLGEDVAAVAVLKQGSSATESAIQMFASRRLANFKIPRRIAIVDRIPKGPTGKVQRRRLAMQLGLDAFGKIGKTREYVPARTDVERTLTSIWRDVLQLESVSVDDHFFELGGDSLKSTQVINRVRGAYGVDLSFLSFFETPTVAQMAASIEALRGETRAGMGPRLDARRNGDAAPLSFAQQRLWFFDQLEPGNPLYHQSWHFYLTGPLSREALQRSLDEILRRHEVLRTKYIAVEGVPEQIVTAFDSLPLSFVDLGAVPETERDTAAKEMALEESRKPFDLTRGPLIRAALARTAEQEHLFSVTVHHVASDGWSGGILFRELTALYAAFLEGKPSPFAPLPVQYADFAIWQRQWMQGELLETHLAYWKNHLAGAPLMLNLSTDHPRPPAQTFRGATEQAALARELTDELRALSRRENATLFMTSVAAFKILLHRLSGQNDIVIGTDVAGRNRTEIEGLIGFFINTPVLRTQLSGNPTFRELLRRVRETALGAYEHQDLPFEKLVEELRPARSLGHHPVFQVMLVLQNAPGAELQLPGLAVRTVQLPVENVVFDLSLQAWQTDEGLRCVLKYNTDLFEAGTARRFLADFEVLLRTILANPEARLSTLVDRLASAGAQAALDERRDHKRRSLETLRIAQRKAVTLQEERKP
jgi:acyl-CoA synthetase (AMP-forming)/AMP-acid ligase II/acyl carrier protein